MQVSRNQIGSELHQGLQWWLDGLKFFIPIVVRRLFVTSGGKLIISMDEQQAKLSLAINGAQVVVETYEFAYGDENVEKSTALHWLSTLDPATKFILLLADDLVLEKRLELPRATETNLYKVLGFEMDRITPFSAQDVYYDAIVLDRGANDDQIAINLHVVLKDTVRPFLEVIKDLGITLDKVTTQGHLNNDRFNLLPETERPFSEPKSHSLDWALAIVGLALLAVTVYLPIIKQHQYVQELERAGVEYRTLALKTKKLAGKKELVMKEAKFLQTKRNAKPATITALNHITQLLPDDSWLSRITLKGREIRIQGESYNAENLISVLEKSEMFSDSRFVSPVVANQKSHRDKFHISIQLADRQSP